MWVPNFTHGYVAYLDRQDGPNKVAQLLLFPIEKARKKRGGVESRPEE